ncbi:MAG: hypothetical protein SGPRY_000931 [Prymnesium sp.]
MMHNAEIRNMKSHHSQALRELKTHIDSQCRILLGSNGSPEMQQINWKQLQPGQTFQIAAAMAAMNGLTPAEVANSWQAQPSAEASAPLRSDSDSCVDPSCKPSAKAIANDTANPTASVKGSNANTDPNVKSNRYANESDNDDNQPKSNAKAAVPPAPADPSPASHCTSQRPAECAPAACHGEQNLSISIPIHLCTPAADVNTTHPPTSLPAKNDASPCDTASHGQARSLPCGAVSNVSNANCPCPTNLSQPSMIHVTPLPSANGNAGSGSMLPVLGGTGHSSSPLIETIPSIPITSGTPAPQTCGLPVLPSALLPPTVIRALARAAGSEPISSTPPPTSAPSTSMAVMGNGDPSGDGASKSDSGGAVLGNRPILSKAVVSIQSSCANQADACAPNPSILAPPPSFATPWPTAVWGGGVGVGTTVDPTVGRSMCPHAATPASAPPPASSATAESKARSSNPKPPPIAEPSPGQKAQSALPCGPCPSSNKQSKDHLINTSYSGGVNAASKSHPSGIVTAIPKVS